VLSKNFVVPNVPPSLWKPDSRVIDWEFIRLLEHSLWTPELEHTLENFSLGAFLDHVVSNDHSGVVGYRDTIALGFFNYLEANVSPPKSRHECQLQLIILIRTNLTSIAPMPLATWNM
jgi:hypothetical protein